MRYRSYAIAMAILLLAGCGERAKDNPVPQPKVEGEAVIFQPGSPQLASLVSEQVTERAAAPSILNGRLSWDEDRTVRVYTPLTGRVNRILVQVGERVKQGQTLAVVASPDLGQAQADARRAAGDYALAKQTLARVKDLQEHGVVAAKEVDSAAADHARAESELKRTQERLKLYSGGAEIDQTYALRSPLGGIIVEKNINPGQELRPDQMGAGVPALFVITDPAYLWALLDASEKDLPRLKVGKLIKVRVAAYPEWTFDARVTAIADFFDPTTRTIKVRATLSNAERMLKGEMFVTATIGAESGPVKQVSTRAVFFQGGSNFVFVDAGNGRYVRRRVQIGESGDGATTVLDGLAMGDKVVSDGALLLQQLLQPRRVVN